MALTLPDTTAWLTEDVGTGDVTTLALVDEDATCTAVVLAKESGVVCGLEAARTVFAELGVGFEPVVGEGASIDRGPIAELDGPARGVLTGERLALNLIGRLSGSPRSRAATSTRSPAPAPPSSTRARRRPAYAPSRSTPSRPAAPRTTASASTTACS